MKSAFLIVTAFMLWEPHDKDILFLLRKARNSPQEMIEKTRNPETHSASRIHFSDELNCSGLLPCVTDSQKEVTQID